MDLSLGHITCFASKIILLTAVCVLLVQKAASFPGPEVAEGFGGGRGGDWDKEAEEAVVTGGIGISPRARAHAPSAAKRAGDYADRFDRAVAIFERSASSRVRRRAYDDMLMLATRVMKHLYALRQRLPNDLVLEEGVVRATEEAESRMHEAMQRCGRAAFGEWPEEVYVLDNMRLDHEGPEARNMSDYRK